MKKYKLIFILAIISLSCNKATFKNDNGNNKNEEFFVEFFYHNKGVMYPMRYSCGKLESGKTDSKPNYKKIQDKEFTGKIVSYYSNLKNAKDERFDARIHLLVHRQKTVDTICMGEAFGIVVNGVTKEDSEEFLNFIKDVLYKKDEGK